MPINHKQQAFINEYMINGHNATKAYSKAYPDSSDKACESNGARLIRNDRIVKAIEGLMAGLAEETGWSVEIALDKLKGIIKDSVAGKQYSSAVSAIVAANRMFKIDIDTQADDGDQERRSRSDEVQSEIDEYNEWKRSKLQLAQEGTKAG